MKFALADKHSAAPATAQASKLSGLEAGRGVAALLVVLRHGWGHCYLAYGSFALGKLFSFGHAGVDFFFVLSGFIIFHAHRSDIGRPRRLMRYVERRVTRIYPLYWIATAFALAAAALSNHPFPTTESIVTSLMLLPTVDFPIVNVAWTLQQEMLFYTIFALLIWNRRVGLLAFATWLVLLISLQVLPVSEHFGLLVKLGSYFNFEFFMGMGAAWLTGRVKVAAPRLILMIGLVAFLIVGGAEDTRMVSNFSIFTHLAYGFAATSMVVGLVAWERRGGFAVPRFLAALGSASYSIYLVHLLAIGAIWQALLFFKLDTALPAWVAYILLVSGAAIGGVIVSTLIEKPVIADIRRRLAVLDPKPLATTAPSQFGREL